ncbi:MAG: hypothetical protein NZ455_14270 [Bacteroidia bacterium]|nr:hypothetical protein [Bacteroidia bacterium]MDW8347323.1 hypothetical protein [Bacteroidia bacterium]
MKYTLYLLLTTVLIALHSSCVKRNLIPAEFNEGEILFQTIKKRPAQIDTHFTLIIVKKNKVKTLFIGQRPHFATVRDLGDSTVRRIYLSHGSKKTFYYQDTSNKTMILLKNMPAYKDTSFWNLPAVKYLFLQKDKRFRFCVLKDVDISADYVQDLPILSGCKIDRFPVWIEAAGDTLQIVSQLIRIEEKDIADIEFEYP